ncbi:DUF2194 domain-containing protein [Pseudothermotoga thermarum]|uniref:DUF2194 domain-containing protein n=1 Tax=Pseudothermotoga thermarum DSM 5069 TaxID=688269 RepID=F7YUX2_9THEM|nr:DUF2194 domain-containing protein [Pseudothermotoga thermarum]AEH51534.1 Protein of unknown function DUF2194 [Pseudothermotoga thermarum DSM 5069]
MKRVLITLLILLLTLSCVAFGEKPFLLLYNPTEQYGEYMMKNHVVPVLEKLGIPYELRSIFGLNYNEIDHQKYAFVISWYYSQNVPYPESYLRQLSIFVKNGGKFFFLNNLGVKTSFREVNNLMNLLGVHYRGGFKTLENSTAQFEKEYFVRAPYGTTSVPAEKYDIFGSDVKKILSYLDETGSEYPMIFLSKTGGGAVFNSFIDKDGRVILNVQKIIESFFETAVGNENKVLVVKSVFDPDEYVRTQKEFIEIFELAKIEVDFVDVTEFYRLSFFELCKYRFIIWNTESTYFETQTIKRYVESGGTFIFCTNIFNTPWNKNVVSQRINVEKLVFVKELFPLHNSADGIKYKIANFVVGFSVVLSDKSTVLAKLEGDGSTPVIWYEERGKGFVGYIYPITVLKPIRGLILQAILEMQNFSISGFLNSVTFHLDDFSLPSYNVEKNGILDDEFYYDVWWKDMKNFSERFGIPFTAMLILTYNGSSSPPFDFTEFFVSRSAGPLKAVLELNQSHHELGFHGYNHISLTAENWKNPENLILSLGVSKEFVERLVGHSIFFTTYTAANNIIDLYGVENLLKAIPEIRVICTSYYYPNFSEYEILSGNVLIVPRSTYGYYPEESVVLTIASSLAHFGSFAHFIHTDDVFASDRNPDGKDWNALYRSLVGIYSQVKSTFPFLRFHTVSEFYKYMVDYMTKSVRYDLDDHGLYINVPKDSLFPRYFFVRAKRKIETVKGGKILSYFAESNLYVVEMNDHYLSIDFTH